MKSVLLGGLKVWLVNDGGRPLSAPGGRAKFYRAGTSTPVTVYSDIDLTEDDALGPVVDTDKLGYLPAIWLKTDKLYKVVVEQRIGVDPEQWEVLWEVDNVGYVDASVWGGGDDRFLFVDSISDLKQVDHSEYGHVFVTGYYAPGDWGEPSLFVWDGDSRKTADDGAYVRPNDVLATDAGRWVQIFDGDILDVRKFGALPDMTQNSDIQGRVLKAINYSQENSTRTRPITVGFVAPGRYDFSGDFDFSIYYFTDIVDGTGQHQLKWFIGNDVVFRNTLETDATFTLAKTTDCRASEALITGEHSLLAVEGGGPVVVDPAWWGDTAMSLSLCYVRFGSVSTNQKTFDRCVIESDGKIAGTASFVNCHVKGEWFNTSSDSLFASSFSFSGCTSSVSEWEDVNKFVIFKNKNGDTTLDLEGRECTLDFYGLSMEHGFTECIDCKFSHLIPPSSGGTWYSGSMKLTGCTVDEFKVTSDNDKLKTLELDGSDITFASSNHVMSACELVARGSSVSGGTTCFRKVKLKDSSVDILRWILGFACDTVDVDIDGCEFKNELDVKMKTDSDGDGIMKVRRSTMKQTIVQYPEYSGGTYVYRFDIRDNEFTRHYITSEDTVSGIVEGSWTGNRSATADPVMFNPSSINGSDSAHSYRYSGNGGTFLPLEMSAVKAYVTPEAHDASPVNPDSYSITTATNNDTSHDFFVLNSDLLYDTLHGYGLGVQVNRFSEPLACFSIGLARYGIGVKFEFDRDTDYGPVSDLTQTLGSVEEVAGIMDLMHDGTTLDAGLLQGMFISKFIPFFNGRAPGNWGRCIVRFDVVRMDGRA